MDKNIKSASERAREELEFSHFVVAANEDSIIGFSRDNSSIYKLLKGAEIGGVKIRSVDQWLELPEKAAQQIRQRAQESYGRVPVYRVPRFML